MSQVDVVFQFLLNTSFSSKNFSWVWLIMETLTRLSSCLITRSRGVQPVLASHIIVDSVLFSNPSEETNNGASGKSGKTEEVARYNHQLYSGRCYIMRILNYH